MYALRRVAKSLGSQYISQICPHKVKRIQDVCLIVHQDKISSITCSVLTLIQMKPCDIVFKKKHLLLIVLTNINFTSSKIDRVLYTYKI